MSDLRVNTISDADGTGPVALTKQSAAKALWAYDQTGPIVNNSFNVSSITDVAAGVPEVNLTSAMSDTNFTFSGAVFSANSDTHVAGSSTSLAAGSFRYWTKDISAGSLDADSRGSLHGDLA